MQTFGKQLIADTQDASVRKGDEPVSRWPRKILLACDGSAHAAKAANVVAAMVSPSAKVRVITVQSYEFAPYTGEWGPLSDEPERQARLKSIIENAFDKPLALLEKTGCEIEKSSRLGNPAEQILLEIGEWQPDLLVVGHAGLGGMAKLLLGSVSEHLVKHAHVPVLVVP